LFDKRIFFVFVFLLLIGGLTWNFSISNQNFERFSYYKEDSRYGLFKGIMEKGLPFENEFENYRFGTSKFVFGEMINYFMPRVPQTFGYQDAGMLNAPRYYDMRWHIWTSEDIEDSIYWLDWFGIKYFEVEDSEVSDKFVNDSRFREVMNYSKGYSFVMYEYLNAKPIVSLVDGVDGKVKEFYFKRDHPDEVVVSYDGFENGDEVLFKEFYHEDWMAKELGSGTNLKVEKVGPGFMGVHPGEGSIGVVFYYHKNFIEYFSMVVSFITLIFLFWKKDFN